MGREICSWHGDRRHDANSWAIISGMGKQTQMNIGILNLPDNFFFSFQNDMRFMMPD